MPFTVRQYHPFPVLLTVILVVLCSAPTWAGFEEGLATYKQGDYSTALKEFRTLAERGDARAQYILSNMYAKGEGVPHDDQLAFWWLQKAAEQELAVAQYSLGAMYYKGEGVPQDYQRAFHLFQKAAKQGNAKAQLYLGLMYANGQAVPQDKQQAVLRYRLAANEGIAEAQYNLATMYLRGDGVPQDYVLAHMWAQVASAAGSPGAPKLQKEVARYMTPGQIAEAQLFAREWKPNLSENHTKRDTMSIEEAIISQR